MGSNFENLTASIDAEASAGWLSKNLCWEAIGPTKGGIDKK